MPPIGRQNAKANPSYSITILSFVVGFANYFDAQKTTVEHPKVYYYLKLMLEPAA
jgi:hypothetical protein